MVSSEVVAVHAPFMANHYYVVNGKIRLTETHPALSQGAWVAAGSLKVGDWLTATDGRSTPVFSVQRIDEQALVYNFRVACGTYVANGIIVHNKENCSEYIQDCPDCPGGP